MLNAGGMLSIMVGFGVGRAIMSLRLVQFDDFILTQNY